MVTWSGRCWPTRPGYHPGQAQTRGWGPGPARKDRPPGACCPGCGELPGRASRTEARGCGPRLTARWGLEAATLPGRGGFPTPTRCPKSVPTGRQRPTRGPSRGLALELGAKRLRAGSRGRGGWARACGGAHVRRWAPPKRLEPGGPSASRPALPGRGAGARPSLAIAAGGRPHSPCPRTAGSRCPRWRRC